MDFSEWIEGAGKFAGVKVINLDSLLQVGIV